MALRDKNSNWASVCKLTKLEGFHDSRVSNYVLWITIISICWLRMEVACSSRTLVPTHQTIWYRNLEHRRMDCKVPLKSTLYVLTRIILKTRDI